MRKKRKRKSLKGSRRERRYAVVYALELEWDSVER